MGEAVHGRVHVHVCVCVGAAVVAEDDMGNKSAKADWESGGSVHVAHACVCVCGGAVHMWLMQVCVCVGGGQCTCGSCKCVCACRSHVLVLMTVRTCKGQVAKVIVEQCNVCSFHLQATASA